MNHGRSHTGEVRLVDDNLLKRFATGSLHWVKWSSSVDLHVIYRRGHHNQFFVKKPSRWKTGFFGLPHECHERQLMKKAGFDLSCVKPEDFLLLCEYIEASQLVSLYNLSSANWHREKDSPKPCQAGGISEQTSFPRF